MAATRPKGRDRPLNLNQIASSIPGAVHFAQKVGLLCEAEGHHLDIGIGWGYCKVEFQTHKINGLHENDFIMAAKINELFGGI